MKWKQINMNLSPVMILKRQDAFSWWLLSPNLTCTRGFGGLFVINKNTIHDSSRVKRIKTHYVEQTGKSLQGLGSVQVLELIRELLKKRRASPQLARS